MRPTERMNWSNLLVLKQARSVGVRVGPETDAGAVAE